VRELREFSATLAAVTGIGLLFFAIPVTWALAYVYNTMERSRP
jgi:hypothetical protein